MVESARLNHRVNALGRPDPDRYTTDTWPAALLERMAYWAQKVHRQGVLLDLGCAEGFLLDKLNMDGFGLDINLARLRLAAAKSIRVCLGDGNRLPFPDNCFDTMISMEVLEHVPDMAPVMQEVHRVLKPGGYWVISAPNVTLRSWYEMWREQRPYYCDSEEHYREFSPVNIPWFEHRFMRTNTLDAMLIDHGFAVAHKDGVRYLFPQWVSRFPMLQSWLESPAADRVWIRIPIICIFPYWIIRIVRKD